MTATSGTSPRGTLGDHWPSARGIALVVAVALGFGFGWAHAAGSPAGTAPGPADLAADLTPLWRCLAGGRESFCVTGTATITRGTDRIAMAVRLERFDRDSFDLSFRHDRYAAVLRRRGDATALALPEHRVVHVGHGPTDPVDHLAPAGAATRLVSTATQLAVLPPLLAQSSASGVAGLLVGLLGFRYDVADARWERGDDWILCADDGRRVMARFADVSVGLQVTDAGSRPEVADFPGYDRNVVPREQLEQTLCRGGRRALEILLPGTVLTNPVHEERVVPHGSLHWIDGIRVVTLAGTPEQIGRAHGRLLADEAVRCVDSVLHLVGTVETVRSGIWFQAKLAGAARRLAPHIPPHHARETRAMAEALALDPVLVASVNVFPELFHCSGFAVAGAATADGTLYHGRVLDYMTQIGLQDAATVFVIAPEGRIPFITVGYAGFTGSVTGMNARRISLGEMGGRGEGRWDGVPMATLMRRALEECTTLDEVIDLWKRCPRTCEYYYVFADGKSRRSVGVGATPERVEIVQPGEGHERLGDGIPDTVVLSSGDRLQCLRERVRQSFGRIDEAAAIRLMDRPVAMRSNLHNVLFIPERLILHVALATHGTPAADCPAVRLDGGLLLRDVPGTEAAETPAEAAKRAGPGAVFPAHDTLAPGTDGRDDARRCLAGLCWEAGPFGVVIERSAAGAGDLRARFPSPVSDGVDCNDDVWMEWYQARDAQGCVTRGPACVVVHESGRGMTVGRLVARGLSAHGIHGFMVQLPFYGERRPRDGRHGPETILSAVRQAVADVRRARDAAAALPLVEAGRVSLQGTSLGGFVSAAAAGLDGGFDKVFIFLAGGDLVGVLENGKRDAAKLRAKLAASGMTEPQVREALLSIEPMRLAHRYRPERTWLFSARHDDVVPPVHCDRLAAAAALPEDHHLRMEANHYSGIIYLPMILSRVAGEIHAVEPDVTAVGR